MFGAVCQCRTSIPTSTFCPLHDGNTEQVLKADCAVDDQAGRDMQTDHLLSVSLVSGVDHRPLTSLQLAPLLAVHERRITPRHTTSARCLVSVAHSMIMSKWLKLQSVPVRPGQAISRCAKCNPPISTRSPSSSSRRMALVSG